MQRIGRSPSHRGEYLQAWRHLLCPIRLACYQSVSRKYSVLRRFLCIARNPLPPEPCGKIQGKNGLFAYVQRVGTVSGRNPKENFGFKRRSKAGRVDGGKIEGKSQMASRPNQRVGRDEWIGSVDPYTPIPIPTEVQHAMPKMFLPVFRQLTKPVVVGTTGTQILVVLVAYRYWMVGTNTDLRTLLNPVWDSLVTGASFAGLFVFLNYTMVSLVCQQSFLNAANSEHDSYRQWVPEPHAKGEWTMPLILALSFVFAVIGIIMSAVHLRLHPVSMFLFTVSLLVLLSCSLRRLVTSR